MKKRHIDSVRRTEILDVMDGLAGDFEFPGFNNEHYETADARMHVYRDEERWAVIIEQLVDWQAASGLERIVSVMGAVNGDTLRTVSLTEPPIQDDVPDKVDVRGESVDVKVDAERDDVAFAVLLQLVEWDRDKLFSTEKELDDVVEPGMKRVLVVDDWAHPDVYGGPKPSESEAFRLIAEVAATGDVSKWKPTETPNNRDWKFWADSR